MPKNADDKDFTRRSFLTAASQGLIVASVAGATIPLAPPDKQPAHLQIPSAPSKKTGWAIVGLGELALNEIMPAFQACEKSRPVALVSGHPDKARQTAEHYGIDPKSIYGYEAFDSIRENQQIDVVYIVLPNHMHAEYTIRALNAGKHVLCEKPMATTTEECEKMIDASRAAKRKLMIAYRLHYEPFNQTMIEFARKQEYGKIRSIEAVNVQNTQAPNIRLSKQTGGGPLGDVGIYCINATRYITGEEPIEFTASMQQPKDDPRFEEVPEGYVWTQKFPSGILATCACGFGAAESRRYRVHAVNGWFELERAFGYRGQQLFVNTEKGRQQIEITPKNHFTEEMDHFSDCVQNNKQPLTPGEEGLADMKIIAMIQQAAEQARTIRV